MKVDRNLHKILNRILDKIEYLDQENERKKPDKNSFGYDKWEHSTHYCDGAFDGYEKACTEISKFIIKVKKGV